MMVDMESARALQIFKTERHPSAQLQIGNSKEGLSVYALLNNCKTAMGKRLLRSWLLLPIQDSDMLLERQKAVQFFVNPENEHAASSLSDFLKKVKDLPGIVGRMQRYRETPTDWMSLFKVHIPLIPCSHSTDEYQSTVHTLAILDYCRPLALHLDVRNLSISLTH